MKEKYFPNNWRAINESPDEWFPSMPWTQFMDWKINGYMIPDSVCCMIRETDSSGKVTEHLKFEVGQLVMITGGHNIGRVGVLITREKHLAG